MTSSTTPGKNRTIVLITGVHVGNLGHAMIQALLETPTPAKDGEGSVWIITARSLAKVETLAQTLEKDAAALNSEIVPMALDLDDEESIERLRKDVTARFGRVDVLVNNAAISLDLEIGAGRMTAGDALAKSFATNVTSTHTLTEAFMPLLFASKSPTPRLIFVSSSVGSLAYHATPGLPINAAGPPGWPKPWEYNILTYRTTKTALNMLALEWSRTLANDPIKVLIVNPGWLATGLGGQPAEEVLQYGGFEPLVGGRFMRTVIEGARDEEEGVMIEKDGVVPW